MSEIVYQGKAKDLREFPREPNLLVQTFRNSATAFNGEKKAELEGKGAYNNEISSMLFRFLRDSYQIPSHFVAQLSPTEMLVKRVEIIPLEVVCRKIVAGSLKGKTGLEEGTELDTWIVEFYSKRDDLGDPMLRNDHIEVLGIATSYQLNRLKHNALMVARALEDLFDYCEMRLVDFKLEYGTEMLLADEISPDTCRIWEKGTNRKLDKDVFRFDLGEAMDGYKLVLSRLTEGIPTYVKELEVKRLEDNK
jgi:phosphoribosylaminoimidazole-succinocarboxamide synthase